MEPGPQYLDIFAKAADIINFCASDEVTADRDLSLDELKILRRKAKDFKIAIEYAIYKYEEALDAAGGPDVVGDKNQAEKI